MFRVWSLGFRLRVKGLEFSKAVAESWSNCKQHVAVAVSGGTSMRMP